MTLTEHLHQHPAKGFRSRPVYFPTGDYLTFYLRDVPHVAERLDDIITVYLSQDARELIGFKVKGVRHILKKAGAFGVGLGDGNGVRLGLFLFAGAAPDRADRLPKMKWYDRLEAFANETVDLNEFTPCGPDR